MDTTLTLSTPPYILSKQDYMDFSNSHSRTAFAKMLPAYARWALYIFFLMGIGAFTWHFYSEEGLPGIVRLLPLILVFVIFMAFMLTAQHLRWRALKNDPLFTHETVISISPIEVSWRSAVHHGAQSWSTVFKVKDAGKVVLIYLNPRMALVIPRRIFSPSEDGDKFSSLAQQFKKSGC